MTLRAATRPTPDAGVLSSIPSTAVGLDLKLL
jgi:hypothetical protein